MPHELEIDALERTAPVPVAVGVGVAVAVGVAEGEAVGLSVGDAVGDGVTVPFTAATNALPKAHCGAVSCVHR